MMKIEQIYLYGLHQRKGTLSRFFVDDEGYSYIQFYFNGKVMKILHNIDKFNFPQKITNNS